MTTITLYTADRQLILLRAPVIASGDRARVELQIHTDPSWTGYRLSAILFCDGEREIACELPLDSTGKCALPPALLAEPRTLQIGLRGLTDDPDTDADAACRTTSLGRFRVAEGTPPEAGETRVNPTDATADENAVLAGETFYAGDGREARTGTIPTYEEGTPTLVAPYTETDPTVPTWAKQPQKPRYTAIEVGARPDDWVPTATEVGARPDDWTPTESDPTVPDWAKNPEKPAYGWDEITDKPFTNGKLNAECLPEGIGTGGGGGGVTELELTSADDLNTVAQSGWYSWGTSVPAHAPILITDAKNSYMRVDRHPAANVITQTVWSAYATAKGFHVTRQIINGTAGAWEWDEPPMVAGVEYRTTERWAGLPVYTKLVDCGLPTNEKTIKFLSVSSPSNVSKTIRYCGTVGSAAMPFFPATDMAHKNMAWFVGYAGSIRIYCGTGISEENQNDHQMFCRVWYIYTT